MPKEKTAEEIVHKAMLPLNVIKENNFLLNKNIDLTEKVKALQAENKKLKEENKLLWQTNSKAAKEVFEMQKDLSQTLAEFLVWDYEKKFNANPDKWYKPFWIKKAKEFLKQRGKET